MRRTRSINQSKEMVLCVCVQSESTCMDESWMSHGHRQQGAAASINGHSVMSISIDPLTIHPSTTLPFIVQVSIWPTSSSNPTCGCHRHRLHPPRRRLRLLLLLSGHSPHGGV
jgi:hypothetical protein